MLSKYRNKNCVGNKKPIVGCHCNSERKEQKHECFLTVKGEETFYFVLKSWVGVDGQIILCFCRECEPMLYRLLVLICKW